MSGSETRTGGARDDGLERAIAAWRAGLLDDGLESEIIDELEDHLRESVARLRADGLDEEMAFRRAAAGLGERAALRHELGRGCGGEAGAARARVGVGGHDPAPGFPEGGERRAAGGRLWERLTPPFAAIAYDLRFATRRALRRPAFAALSILLLAFGIGATTAIFSVVNAVLLEPPPFADVDDLVLLKGMPFTLQNGWPGPAAYLDWRDRLHSFVGFASYHPFGGDANLTGDDGEPARAHVGEVSANFFDLLGVGLELGRGFTDEEAEPGHNQVVVISDGLWRSRYGADPAVLGTVLLLDGYPYTVVGVAPAGLEMPADTEIWTPLAFNGPWMITGARFFEIFARLKPAATLTSAAADVAAFEAAVEAEYPDRGAAEFRVVPLGDDLVSSLRATLWTLMGAVAIVLLVIAANLTNFLLTQAKARAREFSVRAALGGSRGRLIRQALIEAMLLAGAGGVIGLLIALWATRLLAARAAAELPRVATIGLDLPLFGFVIGLSLATGALVGVLPALSASRPDLNAVIKGGAAARRRRWSARDVLVVAQVALALVLLVGAGLLVRSYARARAVELGFDPEHALSFTVTLPSTSYPAERRAQFFEELGARLAGVAGVEAVGMSNFLPLADSSAVGLYLTYGREPEDESAKRSPATFFVVGGDYFAAMGIPLLRGRGFTAADTSDAPPVIIVNEALLAALGIEGSAVGEKIWSGNELREIVGVVPSTHHLGIEDEVAPQVYAPYTQESWRLKYVVARTDGNPMALAAAARAQVRTIDPELPVYDIATMHDRVSAALGRRRLTTWLLSAFGIVALLLAGLGIHGTTSNWVVQRTREIGIRIALGARVADVRRQFLRRGLLLAAAGIVLGLAGGVALTRFVASLLFGVEPLDPATLVAVCAILLAVAVLAIALPVRRAARLDPVASLRGE